MRLHKWNKVVWALSTKGSTVDVVALVGWGDYRLRFDIGRNDTLDGWARRTSTIKAWKIMRYGIRSSTHDYFSKTWVH